MAENDSISPGSTEGSSDRWQTGRADSSGKGDAASDPNAAEGAHEARSLGNRVLRYAAIALASLIGAVFVVLLLFILALQTNWGGAHFADFLLAIANPFSEAYTEYDEVQGNFITRLEFHDLRMYRLDTVYVDTVRSSPVTVRRVRNDGIRSPEELSAFDTLYVDTLQMAVVDTIRMRYDLLRLLHREVRLDELYLANPVLRARQRRDSTWDLTQPFEPDTAAGGQAAFSFNIDELRVTDGELFAIFDPPNPDSVFQVENFNVRARDIGIEESISATLDTLYAAYAPPGRREWTELRAGGSLVENRLHLAGLELESPQSLVTASGRLRLPGEADEEIEEIDFELHADPIAFRDLHPFFPALNPTRSATIDAEVGGSGRLMTVDASVDLSDGGSLALTGTLTPATEGPLTYAAEAQLRHFDPSFFTGTDAAETLVNASVAVDLSGTELKNLDGSATVSLSQSTLAGFELASGRLGADFTDGRADLDLSSSWNGSTVTAEGFIRPFDETPAYELSGRTSGLDLASFGPEDQRSDLDAAFRIEGYGFEPAAAEVDAEIQVGPSTINDYVVDSGTLRLELAGGEMSYGTRLVFTDGLLTADGRADLGDPLTFAVSRGRIENVDLAALLGREAESSLNVHFSLEGAGTDPQAMALSALLEMEPSTYGAYRLQDGEIRADLDDGVLSLAASANLAESGRFNFAAVTRPFDDVPVVRVTSGEFAGVDVGALLQQPDQSTDLTGSASLTVRGFDPETMQVDGSIRLTGSRINEQSINSATADVDLRGGTLAFSASVDLPDGGADLVGTAQPFRDVPTYDVSDGQFRNVNLAAFTGNPALESTLDGRVTLRGTGFDPETMAAQGRIDLDASRINEQAIHSAFVEGRVEDGRFDIDLGLTIPEGTTRLSAVVRPYMDTPAYEVTQGTFAGINVAALTGNPDWQTDLSGEISLSGRGFDPQSMQAEGTVRFDSSRVNDVLLRQGRMTASVRDGLTRFDAGLTFGDGSAEVRGGGRLFADVPTYDVEGALSNVRVGDLVGSDTLAARFTGAFDLEGEGTDPRTMNLTGQIVSSDAFYEGAEVDTLFTQFQLTDGLLRVDSLLLESTAADARGSGVIAVYDTTASSDFRFTADLHDLQPVRSLLAAEKLQLEEGQLEGRVYGRPGTLRFDATGTLRSFIYNEIRVAEFEGTLAGEIQPDSGLTIAEVHGTMQSIALPQFLIQEANVDLTYTPDRIRFGGTVTIDQGRTGEIAGFVETGPDAQRIVLEQMHLTLDDDEWQLLQQATITYGEEYRVSNLLLYSGDQQLAVDGIIDPDGQQNLIMTIEGVEVGAVADLLGYEGLGGTVTGSLVLTGPADAPEMSGTLISDVSSNERDVGELELTLDYADLRLNVDALLTHVDGSTLSTEGYLPFDLRVAQLESGVVTEDLSQGEVDLSVTADSFAMGWIEPFLDPQTIDEFDGRLRADLRVGGTMNSPVLDGSARYSSGRVSLPELGVTYHDIRGDFTLQQNEVQVGNFAIESGPGSIRGDGTVNLAELTLGEFNIDLEADDFLAIDSREYRFVVDGEMVLSGTTQRPVLQGNVDVVTGEILMTNETTAAELERVQLSSEGIQTVERRFGIHVTAEDTTAFSLYDALAMNLDVSIERNTWIRSRVNPIMDIQFSGNLDLQKDHYEDVNMFGTIEVVPQRSRIVQFGKRFDITSGTLTFSGPAGDPLIDVQADYDVRQPGLRGGEAGVTITLTVEGRLSEQLDLTLGSEPQMEYTDIVSYIATGQPASAALQLGGGGGQSLLGAGAGIALDQLTAVMEGLAEAGLGLDVVTLDQSEGQTRITAGTYVTPRLFVAVSQPVAETGTTSGTQTNRPAFTIEYEIQNWLLAQLTQRDQVLRMNLQFEYAY